ncbi:ArnT family glycosyltransferase [Nodularia sphaerocarpa]|uniref:ArnT family glycosyltransferase n=1 Tax=Nodularia sphaerocarpa TaxID=137816 RepID=UPI001EFB0314|nr:glycosyltransferase family 39 protein [Nodularia sphaerocarpa]MDB9373827.1 glycosyltransferase family 39 protein [Nodularia sphaerocarpa CS-585]MDB9380422.1 glycosyltransferase family 39 protein [Nodularia sphaerocarpa CS-585A2]ULP72864.1 Undecaprenyl phosphate-alpha-4-amino-4-deoxy-L-arabinose arabinosyl transferase [Nodularia sphaerocarpa UHCC 0038]
MRIKLSVPGTVNQWCNNLAKSPVFAVTILIVISWLGYGWNLGSVGLIDETEPLFAEASRQMLVTGDWITPIFNGETRFDKPALIYWCQAIAYAIIGVNEWSVRLPSAIASVGVIGLTFYTVQWYFSQKDELEQVSRPTRRNLTALIAAAMLALSPEMIVWGRTGVSDMMLTGCMTSALLCFFRGYASHKETQPESAASLLPNKWYLACYVLIAGAILTKGPVGIVLPILIIGAFMIYVGKFREIFTQMRAFMGMLIIFALSAPWYILVTWRNGWDYLNSFFGYHNVERFTEVVNGHSAPWYFYFLVVLLGFAPYSVYLPVAIARTRFWQRSYWLSQERSQQLGLFACIWFISIFGFFSIAVTKLPSYLLPLMPAVAILVALLWSDFFPENNQDMPSAFSSLKISAWINVIFSTVLAVLLFQITHIINNNSVAPGFPLLIQNAGLPTLGGLIWIFGALIIAGLIISRRWYNIINVNLLLFTFFLIIVLMPALFFMDQLRQQPLRDLSALVLETKQSNEELVMVGFKKPSVAFYTQKPVNYIQLTKDAVEHINNRRSQPAQPPSLLVIAEPKALVKMDLQPGSYDILDTKDTYQLIRVSLRRIKQESLTISSSQSSLFPVKPKV